MRNIATVAVLATMLLTSPGLASNSYVLLNHESQDSYIMPSIAYDAATDQYNVTFIRANNYHDFDMFGWTGNLYAGTMVEQSPGNFSLSIDQCTQLNGMPVMIGTDYGDNPEHNWLHPWQRMLSYSKPSRQGNMIAWSEQMDPWQTLIFYHNFDANSTDILPPTDPTYGGSWGRQINPRVSGDTVSSWGFYRDPSTGAGGWGMRIHDTTENRSIVIDDYRPEDPYWHYYSQMARSGGVYAETSTTGRAIFTMSEGSVNDPMAPLAVYWCQYDLDSQTNTDPNLKTINFIQLTAGLPPDVRVNNIIANDKYVIWHESHSHYPVPLPGAPQEEWEMYYNEVESWGELVAAKWNGSTYDYIGNFWAASSSSQEAALFGDYLVYTDEDCSRILMMDMRDLDDLMAWPDGPPVTILAEASAGGTVEWPAVWVDENTGQYVVLYQSSSSPADLMVATGVAQPGDFVAPAGVDMSDFAVLAAAWQSTEGDDANWNPLCNLAAPDDVIDIADLAVFCDNWLVGTE